ncbi:MAG TPA: PIN domain-containing protein [Candidatus Binatia bacterium]|jgi:predicted nucleic acid-binding protein
MAARYVFDTNVYIQCMLNREFALRHAESYSSRLPATFFSSVVAQELLVGCTNDFAARRVQNFLEPFERVGRIINPAYDDWKEAAWIVMWIGVKRKDLRSKKIALINDAMIALSCRRIGATLVTLNIQDFDVLRGFTSFRFKAFA